MRPPGMVVPHDQLMHLRLEWCDSLGRKRTRGTAAAAGDGDKTPGSASRSAEGFSGARTMPEQHAKTEDLTNRSITDILYIGRKSKRSVS